MINRLCLSTPFYLWISVNVRTTSEYLIRNDKILHLNLSIWKNILSQEVKLVQDMTSIQDFITFSYCRLRNYILYLNDTYLLGKLLKLNLSWRFYMKVCKCLSYKVYGSNCLTLPRPISHILDIYKKCVFINKNT